MGIQPKTRVINQIWIQSLVLLQTSYVAVGKLLHQGIVLLWQMEKLSINYLPKLIYLWFAYRNPQKEINTHVVLTVVTIA